jgi:hypothetical protein
MNLVLQILEFFSAWLDPWLWIATGCLLFALCIVGISPIKDDAESSTLELSLIKIRRFLLAILGTLYLIIPLFIAALSIIVLRSQWYELFNSFFFTVLDSFKKLWTAPAAGLLAGVFFRLFWQRYFLPLRSRFWRQLRFKQSAESLSDIRREKSRLKSQQFLPSKFYKNDSIFYGLNEQKNPVYVSENDWKVHNQKIIGPTQTGKGVLIGVELDQSIRKNHCTIFVDPKGDKHAVHIMHQACKDVGRKLIVLDFTSAVNGLAWEPFLNGSYRERRARLHFAFGLKDTGSDADFYKANERKVIDHVWDQWNGTISDLEDILSTGKLADNSKRTLSYLGEWLHLPAFNSSGESFSLDEFIETGGVLYVRSSLQDETVIKGTTVFLMDLAQSVMRLYEENRRSSHVFAVIDEVRFLMTDLLADSLATICGFNAHFAIAYQSILDLRNLKDKNINALAVEQSVNINCKQTICYMADDTETAEWASDKTGEIQKSVTRMEGIETNAMGGELWEHRRLVNREAENFIPMNVFRMLPERTGVLYFPSELAKILYTCWVPVTEKYQPNKTAKQGGIAGHQEPFEIDQKIKPGDDPDAKPDEPKKTALEDFEVI